MTRAQIGAAAFLIAICCSPSISIATEPPPIRTGLHSGAKSPNPAIGVGGNSEIATNRLQDRSSAAYISIVQRIAALSTHRYVREAKPGVSEQGRKIPVLIITDSAISAASKSRVFICSGQHGDEPNPAPSVVSFCEKLAAGAYPQLLKRCIVVAAPIANPDGMAAKTRLNARGVDINRDWTRTTSRESRYIDSIIRAIRPHVMIDAHEWRAGDLDNSPALPGNGIELSYCRNASQEPPMAGIADLATRASGLTTIRTSRTCNKQLFHRHYCSQGYASFLIETDYGMSSSQKDKTYKSAILAIASAVAQEKEQLASLSPAARDWNPKQTASLFGGAKPKATTKIPVFAVVGCILCYAVLFVLRSRTRQKRDRWHPRKWKPSTISRDEPLFTKHKYNY